MAGTRGTAGLRGEQLRSKILRDNHFDVDHKINEDKIDIQWNAHREILEDTKIDVRVQVNNKAVASVGSLDVTAEVGGRPVSTGIGVEGVVLSEKVLVRVAGTDSPIGDEDSDVVYGLITENEGDYTLTFYSLVAGDEEPYTFGAGAANVDFQFVVRTNLSVIPVDAIIKGGTGFVEGATDAKAYMNLVQLMKDLYGPAGTLDNDGNANLGTNIVQQISDEVTARTSADQAIRNDLASTEAAKGATLVGVIADANYTGLTVQAVLSNLASRLKDAEDELTDAATRSTDSVNQYFLEEEFEAVGDRLANIETVSDAMFHELSGLVTQLLNDGEEEVYEAEGGETSYNLVNGAAQPKSVLLFINGLAQAPGINFDYILDGTDIIGFSFAPETLKGELESPNGVPDVLLVKYKKVAP